jgi:hypothetical protein
MLLLPTQPTLASVFQLLEYIEMNIVDLWMVTFGFKKENTMNASTPSIQ